jgi:chemotaxis signal transduction protein
MNHDDQVGKLISFEISSGDKCLSLSLDVAAVMKLPAENSLIPIPGSFPCLIGCVKYSGTVVPIFNLTEYNTDFKEQASEVLIVNDRSHGYVGLAIKSVDELLLPSLITEDESDDHHKNTVRVGAVKCKEKLFTVINLLSVINEFKKRIDEESTNNEKI